VWNGPKGVIDLGRWRAPQKPSSPYITPKGARALKDELKSLWSKKRPGVVKALSEAAAEGDRSENAEYIYRKKQLGEIDRRIRYLSKRLDVIEIVDRLPSDTGKVRFGAVVTLENEVPETLVYRIVGADETDAALGWISIDSPVARNLLGKQVGDELSVSLPDGKTSLRLIDISYPQPDPN
jgi:transcription elongation factor GreB